MTKEELIKFRNMVNLEIDNRNRINELLIKEDCKELLERTNTQIEFYDTNIMEVIKHVLKSFNISKSNDIYVCIDSYYYGGNEEFYSVSIDEDNFGKKNYKNIETTSSVIASKEFGEYEKIWQIPQAKKFENAHIVLNPYNSAVRPQHNGYEEVRLEFFYECYQNGQNIAIKKILTKYPRLGGN